jgi:hypothetical protein
LEGAALELAEGGAQRLVAADDRGQGGEQSVRLQAAG